MFYYFRVFILIVLLLVVLKAWALKAVEIPTALQTEIGGIPILYEGKCPYEGQQENCMLGVDETTQIGWLLLFTKQGTLYKIVSIKDKVQTVRWVHPYLLT